jgi:Flp pilus assembly pilin Flp
VLAILAKELNVKKLLRKFFAEDQGLESVEWAVLLSLIAVGLIGIVAAIGGIIKGRFSNVQSDLITNGPTG